MSLSGTNCYMIGSGKERIMIDPGDEKSLCKTFYENLGEYLSSTEEFKVNKILLTHAHKDHIGGLHDTIQLLE